MPTPKIPKAFNHHIYFLTFTVRNLYYFFDRQYCWNILARSLQYCQNNKELKLFAFAFILNHKLEYIHNNPVKKQYVMQPEQWYWSSANPFCELKTDLIESM